MPLNHSSSNGSNGDDCTCTGGPFVHGPPKDQGEKDSDEKKDDK